MNTYAMKAIVAAVIFMLTLLRNLKQLGKIASIASLTIFIFAFSIVVYFFIGLKNGQVCPAAPKYELNYFPKTTWPMQILNFIAYIPATSGSYTAHTLIPAMLYEMQGPAQIRSKVLYIALLIAMGLSFLMYMFSGVMGATIFGPGQGDNVLLEFQPCNFVWINII